MFFSEDAELVQNPETIDFNRQMFKKPTHLFFTLYKERQKVKWMGMITTAEIMH